MLKVNDTFPDFELKAVSSSDPETAFDNMNQDTHKEKWKVYFFWPKDFTFVCPTEIVAFGNLINEFRDRDAEVIGVSTDSDFVHLAWRQHHKDLKESPFPWLADIKKELSSSLGILDEEEGVALRATFIVDPHNVIQHASVNNLNVGRNPQEFLRILDALQTDELCPCNWKKGEETL
ncbi:MAG: alkyl hydroperoxide reductase [Legionellaceae bacterium]|nr:alkyl hydroperoxide reductase [Legionellaceae bacterium]|tara:strand:+ start:827 stop:1357 length:531 start_codon:yes stop_codon:yes gene_type:complete